MKRFVQGILVGIALTLAFQFMGPELFELVGVNTKSLTKGVEKIEDKIGRFSKETEDASEQVDKGVKKAGEQVKEILE